MTEFVSDSELTEQEFVNQYMPRGIFTEEYLRARHAWMTGKGNTRELALRMHEAYEKTEACRIHWPNRKI